MITRRFTAVALLTVIGCLMSCTEEKGDPNKETLTAGTSSLFCDAEVAPLILPMLERYQATHPNAHLQISVGDARDGMARLLSAKTRVAVLSRGYLPDEDSLMKVFHVNAHRNFALATDALVFFTRKDFAVDTLSVEALQYHMRDGESLQKRVVDLHFNPSFVAPSAQSGVVGNLRHFCAGDKNISTAVPLRYYSSIDSVKEAVQRTNQIIGIGYLSQLIADTARFKILRIRHTDADSNRSSELVEQSAVYRELYPYRVKLIVYLFEDLQNFPMGVASYLAFEPEPQASFLKKGIVPAYARIKLYEE